MDNINLKDINPIEQLVTPLAPYFICDHFISTEIHSNSCEKYVGMDLNLKAK